MTNNWEEILKQKKSTEEKKQKKVEVGAEGKEKATISDKELALIYEAQDVLGEYLVDKLSNWVNQNPNIEPFLKLFGPYVLTYEVTNYQNGTQAWKMRYTPKISREFFARVLGRVADGYATSTDLLEPVDRGNGIDKDNLKPEDFNLLFPEKPVIGDITSQFNSGYISPYDIVMLMEPEKRPLMAVATKRNFDKRTQYTQSNNYQPNAKVPDLQTVIETAKEFEVRGLREILENFTKYFKKV